MITTFSTSQSCGDIVYAMPLMRQNYEYNGCKAAVWICDTHPKFAPRQQVNTYQAMRRLLLSQEYVQSVRRIDAQDLEKADIQLDKYRKMTFGKDTKLCTDRHFHAQGIAPICDYLRPWISLETEKKYAVVCNATGKYSGHGHDVRKVFERIEGGIFVGLESERKQFMPDNLAFKGCADLLDVANVIASASVFVGEQSAPLTIAQALGLDCKVFLVHKWVLYPKTAATNGRNV
jgi:hypothetical protein